MIYFMNVSFFYSPCIGELCKEQQGVVVWQPAIQTILKQSISRIFNSKSTSWSWRQIIYILFICQLNFACIPVIIISQEHSQCDVDRTHFHDPQLLNVANQIRACDAWCPDQSALSIRAQYINGEQILRICKPIPIVKWLRHLLGMREVPIPEIDPRHWQSQLRKNTLLC